MSIEDEMQPRPKTRRPLEELGVEELQDRIRLLEAEIDDCKAMLKRKGSDRAAADALFSKKGLELQPPLLEPVLALALQRYTRDS